MKYSVVVPVYNEAPSIERLHDALREAMDSLGDSYEIVFVNDGSEDKTQETLERLEKKREGLAIVKLGKNSGKTAALKHGFARAKGEIIAYIDGDLQIDPRDIPFFLAEISEGNDFVCGWRYKRSGTFSRKLISFIGNTLQRLILRTKLHDLSCPIQVYKRECIKNLSLQREGLHRFIPYLLQKKGYKAAETRVRQHPRIYYVATKNSVED